MRSMTLLAYKSMEGSLEEVWTDMGAISFFFQRMIGIS